MKHCCKDFEHHANEHCEKHDNPWDCADFVIAPLSEKLWCMPIRDGGTSGIVFEHCPWCGTALKTPKELGIKSPAKF